MDGVIYNLECLKCRLPVKYNAKYRSPKSLKRHIEYYHGGSTELEAKQPVAGSIATFLKAVDPASLGQPKWGFYEDKAIR